MRKVVAGALGVALAMALVLMWGGGDGTHGA